MESINSLCCWLEFTRWTCTSGRSWHVARAPPPPWARARGHSASQRGRRTNCRAARAMRPGQARCSRPPGAARLRGPARPWRRSCCGAVRAEHLHTRKGSGPGSPLWGRLRAARVPRRCCAPVSALTSTHGLVPSAVTVGAPAGWARMRACSRDTLWSVTPPVSAVRPSLSWVDAASCSRSAVRPSDATGRSSKGPARSTRYAHASPV